MPEQPSRTPLGQPLRWTEAEIEEMSQISPQDVEQAKVWARKNSRPSDGGLSDPATLLDATTDE